MKLYTSSEYQTEYLNDNIHVERIPIEKINSIHPTISKLLNRAKLQILPGQSLIQGTEFYFRQQINTLITVTPNSKKDSYHCICGSGTINYLKQTCKKNIFLTCNVIENVKPDFVQKMHIDDYVSFNLPLISDGKAATIVYKNIQTLIGQSKCESELIDTKIMEAIFGMGRRAFLP